MKTGKFTDVPYFQYLQSKNNSLGLPMGLKINPECSSNDTLK